MRGVPSFSGAKKRFDNEKAEVMRRKALYRDAVLRGEVRISGEGAISALRRMVGPDCAYHLYSRVPSRPR